MFTETTNTLLYVPFNRDYSVDTQIKNTLTTEEFFEHCYVEPNEKVDMGDRTARSNEAQQKFFRWISTNNSAIYFIKGDAGVGKSTYLHHLRYASNKDKKTRWEIVDLQKANKKISFLGKDITIPHFETLHGKTVSAIIHNILSHLFLNLIPKKETDIIPIVENLKDIFAKYKEIQKIFPDQICSAIFNDSSIWNRIHNNKELSINDISKYAQEVKSAFDEIQNNRDKFQQLNTLLILYTTILLTTKNVEKNIIAFDNLERFIKTDEIQNSEVDEFITHLRNSFDHLNGDDPTFSTKIQCTILMRNTTSRMIHTPLHLIDHPGHEMDISGFFAIEKIIEKKTNWYNSKNIDVKNEKYIKYILGTNSFDGTGRISTQRRLEFLFNRNNRLIIEFLSRIISKMSNKILTLFEKFAEKQTEYSTYSARQIIIRLVLDELKNDGLWMLLKVENDSGESVRLGYARKILTILNNFRIDEGSGYMRFDDLIRKLDGGEDYRNIDVEVINQFFDENGRNRRMIISQILFHMNYYNVRAGNWIQFIDIQYQTEKDHICVVNSDDLYHLINEKHETIGIRITLGGMSYLNYLIHTFEYFSCRTSGERTLPLPCTIPTLDELKTQPIDNLTCITTIERVKNDMNACIKTMLERNRDSIDHEFRSLRKKTSTSHTERIIKTYKDHLSRFINTIKEEFADVELNVSEKEKLNMIIQRIEEKKSQINCTKGESDHDKEKEKSI